MSFLVPWSSGPVPYCYYNSYYSYTILYYTINYYILSWFL